MPQPQILSPEDLERLKSNDPAREVTSFWEPTLFQVAVLHRHEKEVALLGGKFSGKSETSRMFLLNGNPDQPNYDQNGRDIWVNQSYIYHPNYTGTVLRRNQVDLDEYLAKLAFRVKPFGGEWKNGRCEFPSGAKIYAGHLADRDAWQKYIGVETIRFVIEEAALIPEMSLYEQILSCCRSIYPEMRPQVLLTSNAGGPGTGWLIERFYEAKDDNGVIVPPGNTITETVDDPLHPDKKLTTTRVFMFSTMRDNPYAENDPSYRGTLAALTDDKMRAAYIDGDWRVFTGAYFQGYRPRGPLQGEPAHARHVIPSLEASKGLRTWWPVQGSLDVGYAHDSAFYLFRSCPNGQHHMFHETVVSKTDWVPLGYRIAQICRPLLAELQSRSIIIWISPDAYHQRGTAGDQGRSIVELLALGCAKVLGAKLVHLPDVMIRDLQEAADDQNAPEVKVAIEKIRALRNSGITFRKAEDSRVIGWQYCRESLRFTEVGTPLAPFDPLLAQKLLALSLERYEQYRSLYKNYKPEALPKLIIHAPDLLPDGTPVPGTGCPQLIAAIPKANHYPLGQPGKSPEDVDKTHFKGMDCLDSWRYGETGLRNPQFNEPFDEMRERLFAQMEQDRPDIEITVRDKILMNQILESREKYRQGSRRPVIIPRKGRSSRYQQWITTERARDQDEPLDFLPN
jgi:hypothetical protein